MDIERVVITRAALNLRNHQTLFHITRLAWRTLWILRERERGREGGREGGCGKERNNIYMSKGRKQGKKWRRTGKNEIRFFKTKPSLSRFTWTIIYMGNSLYATFTVSQKDASVTPTLLRVYTKTIYPHFFSVVNNGVYIVDCRVSLSLLRNTTICLVLGQHGAHFSCILASKGNFRNCCALAIASFPVKIKTIQDSPLYSKNESMTHKINTKGKN